MKMTSDAIYIKLKNIWNNFLGFVYSNTTIRKNKEMFKNTDWWVPTREEEGDSLGVHHSAMFFVVSWL